MPGIIYRDDDYAADSLFGRPPIERQVVPFRAVGPDTTRAAQNAAYPKSGTQRRRVYDAIHAAPDGLTNDEISQLLDMLIQSVCPATNTLARDGWIFDNGDRRETRSGHQAIVWRTR